MTSMQPALTHPLLWEGGPEALTSAFELQLVYSTLLSAPWGTGGGRVDGRMGEGGEGGVDRGGKAGGGDDGAGGWGRRGERSNKEGFRW